jgi:cell division protein FtsN
MSHNYKPGYANIRSSKGQSSLLPFLTGLTIGLFMAWFLYLHAQSPEKRDLHAEPPKHNLAAQDTLGKSTQSSVEPGTKPRFDFYTILSEMEVKVPEGESPAEESRQEEKITREAGKTRKPAEKQPLEKPERGTVYTLQAGSFQHSGEAERARSQLAGIGIAADIQRVVIDKDTWYRVKIGPIKSPAELESMRSRLVKNKINFIMTRTKTGIAAGRG